MKTLLTDHLKLLLNFLRALPYLATRWEPAEDKLVIVTGADSSHFTNLCQFLLSAVRHERGTPIIMYDLGLTTEQSTAVRAQFPSVKYRMFDYSSYPEHFNIKINAGEYAWKPAIIYEVLSQFRCCVCWMDAGNLITGPLKWLRRFVKRDGLYSPRSMGTISEWTHPGTLEYLNAPDDILSQRNLNGACVAMSYHHAPARELVQRWKECALVRDCIAPEGSSKLNHRQDQAVLTVLAHQRGMAHKMPPAMYGFITHRDIKKRS